MLSMFNLENQLFFVIYMLFFIRSRAVSLKNLSNVVSNINNYN